MTELDLTRTAVINAGPDRLWEILGDDFLDVAHWVRSIASSGANPNAPRNDAGREGGRSCEIAGFGTTDERLTRFDPGTRSLAYTVAARKIPPFVKDMHNEWSVDDLGDGRARVTSRITADASGPMGALIAPMMRRKLSATQKDILEDLAAYAETGAPSEAKQKANMKRGARVSPQPS
ncbi:MAG: SRPBCC family protein [Acidimicrobiales bacterium]